MHCHRRAPWHNQHGVLPLPAMVCCLLPAIICCLLPLSAVRGPYGHWLLLRRPKVVSFHFVLCRGTRAGLHMRGVSRLRVAVRRSQHFRQPVISSLC
ncbi:hypothetical protein GGR56DRAFT_610796 [Xylariaceae sp. FL0804]|nr:hypothetical protein GGR56DRAFT_610796 [Xylariaceae sp. FL0804]